MLSSCEVCKAGSLAPPWGNNCVCVTSTEKLGNQLTYRDPENYQRKFNPPLNYTYNSKIHWIGTPIFKLENDE